MQLSTVHSTVSVKDAGELVQSVITNSAPIASSLTPGPSLKAAELNLQDQEKIGDTSILKWPQCTASGCFYLVVMAKIWPCFSKGVAAGSCLGKWRVEEWAEDVWSRTGGRC